MFPRVKTYTPFYVIAVVALVILSIRIVYPRIGPALIRNDTASEPRGFYWLEQHSSSNYKRGQLVAFPVPATFRSLVYGRHWLREGTPLMKQIGALEGDLVCIDHVQARVNGRLIGKIFEVDSQGRPLPELRGCFPILPGYFLPISTYIDNSFDGRYMGPQPLTSVIGELHPIWTF